MRIVSIGEILWDVISGNEYLGGAPFNFAAHVGRLGHEVKFLSAVGDDDRGRLALDKAAELGIQTDLLKVTDHAPTGVSIVSLSEAGHGEHRLPRPAAYDYVSLSSAEEAQLKAWKPDWIYFGTLLQMSDEPRRLTTQLCESNPAAQRFYDVNLRPNNYSPEVVREMLSLATIVKLNDEEADVIADIAGVDRPVLWRPFCTDFAAKYHLKALCITRGKNGSVLFRPDPEDYAECPGYVIEVADTVGAGDAFSAAFVHGWGEGWDMRRIGEFANGAGALVASQHGATPKWSMQEALAMAG